MTVPGEGLEEDHLLVLHPQVTEEAVTVNPRLALVARGAPVEMTMASRLGAIPGAGGVTIRMTATSNTKADDPPVMRGTGWRNQNH